VVIWDNFNSHVSRAMAELIAARDWLTVYRLPAYASELNPVESVWSVLKRSLANLAKRDIGQLTALVKTRLRRIGFKPQLSLRAKPQPVPTNLSAAFRVASIAVPAPAAILRSRAST